MKKNKKKSKAVLREVAKGFLVLFLSFLIFSSGAYLAVHSDVVKRMAEGEVLYLGQIKGKYNYQDKKWSQNVDFDMYWDVWNFLKKTYVDQESLNEKKMFYGSLRGLLSSLDDPYSEFMDPQENRDFEDDMAGSFEGIGAEIGIRDSVLTVISPLSGSPAQAAGLMAGDKIIEINGESTRDMNINDAVSRIKGPKGTEVVLSIFRESLDDFKEIKIVRDLILITSVESEKINDNIYLIKVSSFNSDTGLLFYQAIKEMLSSGANKLIVDLRNNPGGFLEVVVDVLGEWVDGEVAVIEKFSEDNLVEHRSKGSDLLKDIETVILTNEGSASASEILAGALRDYAKATIIGKKTYGKGSVQVVKRLRDGSAIKVTVAEWLTPNGHNINQEGIEPDIEIELSYDDFIANLDPQLDAAIDFLSEVK